MGEQKTNSVSRCLAKLENMKTGCLVVACAATTTAAPLALDWYLVERNDDIRYMIIRLLAPMWGNACALAYSLSYFAFLLAFTWALLSCIARTINPQAEVPFCGTKGRGRWHR